MPNPASGARRWTGRALDAGTWLLLLVGLAFLVRDRLVPAWEASRRVAVGEAVPDELRLMSLASGDTLAPASPGVPTVYLIFQSTCPACERNLPAWRRLLEAVPGARALALGLEEAGTALDYVRANLPEALAVDAVDRNAFVRRLQVSVVPTTLAVDDRGVLTRRVDGVLSADAVEALVPALESEGPDDGKGLRLPSAAGR